MDALIREELQRARASDDLAALREVERKLKRVMPPNLASREVFGVGPDDVLLLKGRTVLHIPAMPSLNYPRAGRIIGGTDGGEVWRMRIHGPNEIVVNSICGRTTGKRSSIAHVDYWSIERICGHCTSQLPSKEHLSSLSHRLAIAAFWPTGKKPWRPLRLCGLHVRYRPLSVLLRGAHVNPWLRSTQTVRGSEASAY